MKILDSYKTIAKELIKESAWDRKFGEPLPTLQDVMNEVDDDKIIKYKKKDGEQGEMKASSAKTMPDDHPAKQAYNKMKGDDSGEKDSGGKLGGGDFERDISDDEPDMDSDGADDKDDVRDALDGAFDGISNAVSRGLDYYDDQDVAQMIDKDLQWAFHKGADDDDILNMAKELDPAGREILRQALGNMGIEDINVTSDDMDETITINGKTYIPIKESKEPTKPKVHPFKQAYKKIGGK